MEKFVFLLILKLVSSKELKVELPLCPTNIQYLPQSLPMHCRMPRNANFASYPNGLTNQAPTLPPFIPQYYQSPPPEKAAPYPFPVAPFPVMQMPGAMPMPAPMPMPVNSNGPAHKLPVIVMPFYSPDPSYSNKHRSNHQPPRTTRRPRYLSDDTDPDTDTDTDTDTDSTDSSSETDTDSSDSSDRGWWKSKRGFRRSSARRSHKHHAHRVKKKHRNDIVTPVLQYVNRNGYVIYEKKISKDEAKEWLKGDPVMQEPKKEYSEEDDEGVVDRNMVQEEKPKGKSQPEKPHHVSTLLQTPVKKHRQLKYSKEAKQSD